MNDKTETKKTERSLAEQLKERGISNEQWRTLQYSLYPGAKQQSVLLVVDYCRARGLDPLKRPCHIVPIEVKTKDESGKTAWEWRDTVMPGIYELRTTAHRTGKYLGHTAPVYGPLAEFMGVFAPEYCEMTFRRATEYGVAEFPVRTLFAEVVGTAWDAAEKKPYVNARWRRSPVQMLTKCCEAAGLREGFPEELGGEIAFEESDTASERATPQPLALPDRSTEASPLDELNASLEVVETVEVAHEAAASRAE